MSLLERLVVEVTGDTKGVDKALTGTQTTMKSLAALAVRLAPVIGLGAIARNIVKNSIESQRAIAQLGAVVQSTGGIAGRSVAQLQDMATALQKVSTFGDEAVMSAQAMLLTFTNIRGGVFDQATKSVMNLATAMASSTGGVPDLKNAAIQVGKALNDPVLGATALQRVGIQLSAQQKQSIKDFMAVNDIASAQAVILKELEVQFGGSAEALRNTLGGALAGLKNAWGDLFEVSRESSSGVIGAINGITDTLPKLRAGIDSIANAIQRMGIQAAVHVEALKVLWEAAKPFALVTPGGWAAIRAQYGQMVLMKQAAAEMLAPAPYGPQLPGITPPGAGALGGAGGIPRVGYGTIGDISPAVGGPAYGLTSNRMLGGFGYNYRAGLPTPYAGPLPGIPAAGGEMGALGKLGGAFSAGLDKATGMLTQFGPAGLILAAVFEVLKGALEPLQPVIDMLKEPLRIIGTLIGQNLAPILKMLVPIVKIAAVAFTYLQQATGYLIQAFGWLVDHLVPDFISKVGQGIEKYGKEMVENSKAARNALGATNNLTDSMEKLNDALRNIPSGLKLAFRRFQATEGYAPGGGSTGGRSRRPARGCRGSSSSPGACPAPSPPAPARAPPPSAAERAAWRPRAAEAARSTRPPGPTDARPPSPRAPPPRT